MKYEMRSRDLTEFTLGTLASLTAVVGGTKIDAARLQGCDIRKLKYSVGLLGKTSGASEGPVAFGVSMGNTAAEIAAFYAADPQGQDDELEQARAHLPIVELGRFDQTSQSTETLVDPTNTRLQKGYWGGWPVREGVAWQHYVFNANPNDPLSTGGLLQLYTEVYGDWRQD